MSDIHAELNRRIASCIKRKTGIDVLLPSVYAELELEDRALVQEAGFTCALRIIKKLAKTKFVKWAEKELEEIGVRAEEVGTRFIRFNAKVGDPVGVYQELNLLTRVVKKLIEEFDESDFLDPALVPRLLVITSLAEMRSRLTLNSLRPLLFAAGMAETALNLDMNWCASLIALTVEEIFVKKTAAKLGLQIGEKENSLSILNKLISYMTHNKIRHSHEILLGEGHRRIRNDVLHEGRKPTEDETAEIVSHVLKMVRFLDTSVKAAVESDVIE